MNNNKQVIRFFLLALFITIICLSTNAFAAEEIGSISNPASLKVGGGIHKYSFKKSENGKIVTSQLGLSLEEVLSGDDAEKINQSIN